MLKKIVLQGLCSGLFLLNAHAWDGFELNNLYMYSAKGVDDNLREIPGDIFDLPFEDTWLYAVGTFIPHQLDVLKPYESWEFGSSWIIVKHTGMQSHIEVDAAATLKYKALFPENDYINTDIAFGIGLSYAFDTPYYEDPYVHDDGTEEYYRFQSYLHFDAELYTPSLSQLHLLLRIHHRSGIYGLFAPEHVGSNFAGIGLVYYFGQK